MNAFSKTVHPHGRGDNATTHRLRKTTSGSPPRAWGQSQRRGAAGDAARFTPTGVGTIIIRRRSAEHGAVHPHGRGDNVVRLAAAGAFVRFTPTGVGTMYEMTVFIPESPVHPHGRGDNGGWLLLFLWRLGSPPRAWGQLIDLLSIIAALRFTPTGVGTICSPEPLRSPVSVHPHGRGDNQIVVERTGLCDGSPPRAWGQLRCERHRHAAHRFTPTGVGTIARLDRSDKSHTVHPHGRGDNALGGFQAMVDDGSPPRAWGQCPAPARAARAGRFTPTGVGTMRQCGAH